MGREAGEMGETEETGETGARCSHYVLLTLPGASPAPEASPALEVPNAPSGCAICHFRVIPQNFEFQPGMPLVDGKLTICIMTTTQGYSIPTPS